MAEPFKNLIDVPLVAKTARHLQRVWPQFDRKRFERLATHGLGTLELKARAMQLADALEATLPERFSTAAELIERALGPPIDGDGLTNGTISDDGLAGWVIWPIGEFIARRGQADPQRALQALHAITQRLSAEFAIRPFVLAHPELVFRTLEGWISDPSEHVRRLVSEGTRPRLPWGMQLKPLIADPSPSLPLLRALQDDPSPYVRRSVANHLNDIAKDHPDLVAAWIRQHLAGASPERRALLRHASRTLIKQGHRATLQAWGLAGRFVGKAVLTLEPKRVRVGGHLAITVELTSRSKRLQRLAIDYVVHHVKASGSLTPKVFKGWALQLAPGEQRTVQKRHSLKLVTTRRYHAGRHLIELSINGTVVASAPFELRLPAR